MRAVTKLVFWFVLLATPAFAQDSGPTSIVREFTQAWGAGDAKAISLLFQPDADLIAPDGITATGRGAIQAYYSAAFARGYGGSTGVGHIFQQRTLSPDLVLLDASFAIIGARKGDGSPGPDQKGAMAVLLRHVAGHWRIVALRERSGGDFTRLNDTH